MLDLLRRIRSKGDAFAFFSKPVNPEDDDCPDYFEVVDKVRAGGQDRRSEAVDNCES